MTFPDTFNSLLNEAQRLTDAGASLQEVYGALNAVTVRVEYLMTEEYRTAKILTDWDKTVETHKHEPPLVEAEGDN